jgi:hypothetical protein
MKKMVVVCLGVLMLWSLATGAPSSPEPESFALADRIGEPNARSFFMFSTSVGSYTLRQDGMGEFTSPKGLRRVFYLRLGAKGSIERVYFIEHQGDLFLIYEVQDATSQSSYLLRMEQQKRKPRWITALPGDVQEPTIEAGRVIIKGTEISTFNGAVVKQD